MKVAVYSIQHTGTRFVLSFFKAHGIEMFHRHAGHEYLRPEWLRIIPVRNPYDCWKTWSRRRRDEFTDLEFVAMWAKYIFRVEHQDCFYFPLDIDPRRRQWMLKEAIEFISDKPDLDIIKPFANAWKAKGATLRPDERAAIEVPDDVTKALAWAHEWYEHYTANYGAHVRYCDDMIGERL